MVVVETVEALSAVWQPGPGAVILFGLPKAAKLLFDVKVVPVLLQLTKLALEASLLLGKHTQDRAG